HHARALQSLGIAVEIGQCAGFATPDVRETWTGEVLARFERMARSARAEYACAARRVAGGHCRLRTLRDYAY
ncbi:MAG TPA: hypothetical protein VFA81_13250, partial [Burkholderiales bacterium]|nr:hypothetical protein [Burkholderiales bacterium]